MVKFFRKILFLLWPPFEANFAQRSLDKTASIYKETLKKIQANVKKGFAKNIDISDELENLAKLVYESENKRRDSIESKSLVYMSSFSIIISIASVLPALMNGQWNIPIPASLVLVIVYVLGIIHLITAVYWAVIVRRIAGIALPNVDQYVSLISGQKWTTQERILFYISQAKFNEPILTKKANSLVVAENMFIRGLFLISAATIISGVLLLFSGTGRTEIAACKIPNIVGMNYIESEKMLLELGLRPVRTNRLSSDFAPDIVIAQEPVAGSIQPCNSDVVITISFRITPTVSPTVSPTKTLQATRTYTPVAPLQIKTP
ncbi:MAG: PASTA domain-containing protein [Bacteroidetes bacterium]|nr:PASTA domain-containing protein [Bacteroidota bacterium]